jgi:hypothetical protein
MFFFWNILIKNIILKDILISFLRYYFQLGTLNGIFLLIIH